MSASICENRFGCKFFTVLLFLNETMSKQSGEHTSKYMDEMIAKKTELILQAICLLMSCEAPFKGYSISSDTCGKNLSTIVLQLRLV